MTATPIDVAVNPNNTDQRYILWGNGRIDALGGAVPITGQATWYERVDQPIAVALYIKDWATGQGYVLDLYAGTHPLNGAPAIGSDGTLAGVPYTNPTRRYVDWDWNPDGSGQGYVLDQYGQLYPFGGASAPPRAGRMWTWAAAKRLVMRWSPDIRGVIMDLYGGTHPQFSCPPIPGGGGAFWPWGDIARDIVITDWSAPMGYKLDLYGGVHEFGGAPATFGWPYRPGANAARTLAVISATDPIRMWQVWNGGQEFEWVSSTPPTVVAGGSDPVSPAATVTGTTRPILSWTYSDPQSDSQAAWDLYVYDQAFVNTYTITAEDGSVIADPLTFYGPQVAADHALVHETGINPTTRGIASPVDLPNGTYRMYVRAQDSSGKWSPWADHGWTQNVPVPVTPTGLTAVATYTAPSIGVEVQGADQFAVSLSVIATAGGAADLVRFDCSDDGGTTWHPVRGADAVPLAATTTATDWDAPLGIPRTYRATAYAVDPAVASLPSDTATATIPLRTYVVTSVDNPAIGGRLAVQGSVEWTLSRPGGVFQGLGAGWATVVSDPDTWTHRTSLHIAALSEAAADMVTDLIRAAGDLVYRDPFGNVRYARYIGDAPKAQMDKAALRSEFTFDLPLIEVRPPYLED